MRITVFNYGSGNLHSLIKALDHLEYTIAVETDPVAAINTDLLVLPGVGAFTSAAECLAPGRDAMRQAIAQGLPCLGICLGMQLMFDQSEEGAGNGLGIFPGHVRRLQAQRVPQIGWNSLDNVSDPMFAGCTLHDVYYANSYVCAPVDHSAVVAWSTHEDDRFPAVVRMGSVLGVQFHPEKSSQPGIRMLHTFLRETLT